MKPTPEMIEKWWRESKIVGLAPVNLEWEQRAFTLAYADGYDAGYAAGTAQQRETDGAVTVTTNDRGEVVAITRTDEEHRILSVIWERAQQEAKG